MYRYLLNFSYIGTNFRGVQKNITKDDIFNIDPTTIQGQLEIGLKNFKSINEPYVYISSRTDAGVHALNSAGHVDLEKRNKTPYNPGSITIGLNKYLRRNELSLRVLNTRIVPLTFHARYNAQSRTYLYRLGVIKDHFAKDINPKIRRHLVEYPIEEFQRCHFLFNPRFDLSAVREAASLIEGYHDFRTFMGSPKLQRPGILTLRKIDNLSISPGEEGLQISDSSSIFNYWNIKCTAKSFLYRQVRRIVGVLVGVGQGVLTLQDVRTMLQVPSPNSWHPKAVCAPPHGLYLCNVEYKPEDLILPEDSATS